MCPIGEARAGDFPVERFAEVGSTNDLALAAFDSGELRGRWFVAAKQTAGRGRLGRHWNSPAGNLHASLLLVAPCPMVMAPRLGFVAGTALRAALSSLAPQVDWRLKWPNDVVVGPAKAGGILLEGRSRGQVAAVVIGIGVNVRAGPDDVAYPTTSLLAEGSHCDAGELFSALAREMSRQLDVFAEGQGADRIIEEWRRHAIDEGTPLHVTHAGERREGIYRGIDSEGRLRIEAGGRMVLLNAGDVGVLPHALERATTLTGEA